MNIGQTEAHGEVNKGADVAAIMGGEAGTRPAPENAPWAGSGGLADPPAVPAWLFPPGR
jgi:hypothetical protein